MIITNHNITGEINFNTYLGEIDGEKQYGSFFKMTKDAFLFDNTQSINIKPTTYHNGETYFINKAYFNDQINTKKPVHILNTLIGGSKNINSNIALGLPIEEYIVLHQDNINITATLPFIPTDEFNRSGITTTFFSIVKNSTCKIVPASGSKLYDMDRNLITEITLSSKTNQSIVFEVVAHEWYIRNIVNFNNPIYKSIDIIDNLNVGKDINIGNSLTVSKDITLRNAIIYDKVFNITGSIDLTLPFYKTYRYNPPSNQLLIRSVILPVLNNNELDGITFEFINSSSTHTVTIGVPTGNILYDIYGNFTPVIQLKASGVERVKFMIQENKYYVLETKQRDNTCGYILDGVLTGRSIMNPIICSCKYLNPENGADAAVVNPGYKFECFVDFEYLGNVETFDNMEGLTPKYFTFTNANLTSSIKVYYKGALITFPNIS